MSGQGTPSDWQVGAITLMGTSNGVPTLLPVAGWVKGPFGLDARVFVDDDDELIPGFVLTHLPTGYVVRQLHCGLAEAQEIADEIAVGADWGFDNGQDAEALGRCRPVIADVMRRYPGIVTGGVRTVGPAA